MPQGDLPLTVPALPFLQPVVVKNQHDRDHQRKENWDRVAETQTDTGPFPPLMLFGLDTTVPKGDATDGSMKSTGTC